MVYFSNIIFSAMHPQRSITASQQYSDGKVCFMNFAPWRLFPIQKCSYLTRKLNEYKSGCESYNFIRRFVELFRCAKHELYVKASTHPKSMATPKKSCFKKLFMCNFFTCLVLMPIFCTFCRLKVVSSSFPSSLSLISI